MPWRALLTKEMAEFLGVLAHPHRVRIIQELRNGEVDVNGLQKVLEISHSRVSQHLSIMRSHRLVAERRDGRHVYYRVVQHKLAQWLADGLDFLHQDSVHSHEVEDALRRSRSIWTEDPAQSKSSSKPAPQPNTGVVTTADSEGYL